MVDYGCYEDPLQHEVASPHITVSILHTDTISPGLRVAGRAGDE